MSRRYTYKPLISLDIPEPVAAELNKIAEALAVEDLYNQLHMPLLFAKVPAAGAPGFITYRDGLKAYAFDDTTAEEVFFTFTIPNTYKAGADLHLDVHWSPGNNTDTGTVRWGFEYTVCKSHDQEAFPASTTIYAEQAGNGTAYYNQGIETAEIDGSALEEESIMLLRLFRDATHANDDFVGDAFAFAVNVHFLSNKTGTEQDHPPYD